MHLARSFQTFLRTLFSSVWRPTWYAEARTLPTSFAWKFFTGLHVLTGMLLLVPVLVLLASFDSHAFLERAGDVIRTTYPSDLIITIQDGRLSVNRDLPYRLPVPPQWKRVLETAESDTEIPSTLVLFTRDADISTAELYEADALLIATETQVHFVDPTRREIRSIPLDDAQDVLVTRAVVDAAVTEFTAVVRDQWWLQPTFYIPALGMLLLLVALPLLLILRLVQLVVYAFFGWIVAMLFLRDREWSYPDVLRMSVFSLTPVLVVGWMLMLLGLPSFNFRVALLVYLVWTMYVLWVAGGASPSAAMPPTPVHRAPAGGSTKKVVATAPRKKAAKEKIATKN